MRNWIFAHKFPRTGIAGLLFLHVRSVIQDHATLDPVFAHIARKGVARFCIPYRMTPPCRHKDISR